ncbi:branched-chain amino acid ABC transporter ATP-binding protein/permease [Bacillus sp. EB106-08-02-XG196]|jgi:branched-chain amino acid transport system permease protein|uniref:branched-chain amino acid ABC transporter ATP-binding protein/permease n=1 Tax=Bacillus sp. EB106-08-02-XG196 TaxID=2737049 RepID=UPI0015C4A3BE|nr:branched-chain amino acid ABC transporter ATP-binding protein/permease [Bacillus sp. EB106-08-02-XG196]NWQ41869.1 branched-chain amino acid ABC transporter ATP-binding protein/permease [Bacillus sp. EB106-08-02-XG196]
MRKQGTWILSGILIILLCLPQFLNPYYLQLFIFLFINILLAQSINLLSGYTGLISIGHAGFFAIGAYASAVLMIKLSLPFMLTLFLAVFISMVIGFLLSIPAGRVREFYLALMTLGFGLIVEVITKEWTLLGGFSGLSNIPSPVLRNLQIFGFTIDHVTYYYMTLGALLLTSIFIRKMIRSYFGRTLLAVRTNEIAAASVGIHPGYVKQQAFIISAAMAGSAGVLYAHYISFISHGQFTIMKSISMLAMAIIGGLGSFIGPFLGGIFETWIPQLLQSFDQYQLIIYGVLLVFVIRFFPKGLAGFFKVKESYLNISSSKFEDLLTTEPLPAVKYLNYQGDTQKDILLEVREVSKAFGGLKALKEISLSVQSGEIHGLIGPNGSGKSTLVNVITGAYTADSGMVTFHQQDITNRPLHQNARRGIIRIFQDPRIISEATVLENVMLGAQINVANGAVSKIGGFHSSQEVEWAKQALEAIHLCGLKDYTFQEAGTLPYGLRRLIEVARAIVAKPNLLILDEPAAGLSEKETEDLTHLLRRLKAEGLSIIIIEHDMEFLLSLLDSVTVLDYGEVIYQGNIEGMQRDENVIEAYLGVV